MQVELLFSQHLAPEERKQVRGGGAQLDIGSHPIWLLIKLLARIIHKREQVGLEALKQPSGTPTFV